MATLKVNKSNKKMFNLGVLQRIDPKIWDIVDDCSHVVVYNFEPAKGSWEKGDIEGAAFVTPFSIVVLNKNGPNNFNIELCDIINIKMQLPYIMLRYATAGAPAIVGIWCHDEAERDSMYQSITKTMEKVKSGNGNGNVNNNNVNSVLNIGSSGAGAGNTKSSVADTAGKTNALKNLLSLPVSKVKINEAASETKISGTSGTDVLKGLLAVKGNKGASPPVNAAAASANINASTGKENEGKKLLAALGASGKKNKGGGGAKTPVRGQVQDDDIDLFSDRDIAGKFNGKSASGSVQQNNYITDGASSDFARVSKKGEEVTIPKHHLLAGGTGSSGGAGSTFFDTHANISTPVTEKTEKKANKANVGGKMLMAALGGGGVKGGRKSTSPVPSNSLMSTPSMAASTTSPIPTAKSLNGLSSLTNGVSGMMPVSGVNGVTNLPKKLASFMSPSDLLKM